MGFKAGVKKFGSRAEDAERAEFNQLNEYDCLTPWNDLTPRKRKTALEYLLLIQQKRNERMKARGCADGQKQRAYLEKADVTLMHTSPVHGTKQIRHTNILQGPGTAIS